MAATWENYWEKHGVVTRFRDELTADALIESGRDVYDDARFRDIGYWFSDFSGIAAAPITADELKRVALLDREGTILNPNLFVAAISPPMILRGLFNMLAAYHGNQESQWKFEIFDDEETARRWVAANVTNPD